MQEGHGRLLCKFTPVRGDALSFYFDGEESTVLMVKGQYDIQRGFNYSRFQFPVRLPWNTAAASMFITKEDALAGVPDEAKANARPSEFNIGVVMSQDRAIPYTAPGTLTPLNRKDEAHQTLLVGYPTAPLVDYDYSNFKSYRGVMIPASVKMRLFDQVAPEHTGGQFKSTLKNEFLLSLESASLEDNLPALTDIVITGDTVQYHGKRGNAAFKYDGKNGSIEKQLEHAIDVHQSIRDANGQQKGRLAIRDWSFVPLTLTGIFAVLAVYFLIKGGKTRS